MEYIKKKKMMKFVKNYKVTMTSPQARKGCLT